MAAEQVAGVVDAWLDAAYVGGDYPRSDFGDAFPGSRRTPPALAERDAGLMSNSDVGGPGRQRRPPKRRVVRLDVLAAEARPPA